MTIFAIATGIDAYFPLLLPPPPLLLPLMANKHIEILEWQDDKRREEINTIGCREGGSHDNKLLVFLIE